MTMATMSGSIILIYIVVLISGDIGTLQLGVITSRSVLVFDYFQYWLIIMCLLIIILSIYPIYKDIYREHFSSLTISWVLNSNLVLSLSGRTNMVHFFMLFEISIIPIFIIIINWGYQPEKVKAAYALFFFTAVSASPLLVIILLRNTYTLRSNVSVLSDFRSSRFYSRIQIIFFLTGFLVKLPVYGLHLWLPLAHVEAPVYGSMILAGILLKLGGLGMIRFSCYISCLNFNYIIVFTRLIGILLVGGVCLQSTDLKKIIAFSSVAHIAFCIFLLIMKTKTRVWVGFRIFIVHAFSSSGMFFVVYYFYLETRSRNILINAGMLGRKPLLRLFWLATIIARLGAPPSVNLLAEIWALIISFLVLYKFVIVLIVRFILGSCYHVILYRRIIQGNSLWNSISVIWNSSSVRINFVSFLHLLLSTIPILVLRVYTF